MWENTQMGRYSGHWELAIGVAGARNTRCLHGQEEVIVVQPREQPQKNAFKPVWNSEDGDLARGDRLQISKADRCTAVGPACGFDGEHLSVLSVLLFQVAAKSLQCAITQWVLEIARDAKHACTKRVSLALWTNNAIKTVSELQPSFFLWPNKIKSVRSRAATRNG